MWSRLPASGLSYPVVRGALPAATGFFLDGVRVPQRYHLLAGGSVIHPDFIESIDFYPANAPALANFVGNVPDRAALDELRQVL